MAVHDVLLSVVHTSPSLTAANEKPEAAGGASAVWFGIYSTTSRMTGGKRPVYRKRRPRWADVEMFLERATGIEPAL